MATSRGRVGVACLAGVLATSVLAGSSPAATAGGVPVPSGWRSASWKLADGVHLARLWTRWQVISVTRIDPTAAVDLQQVVSNDRISGPAPRTERTTSMCARRSCLAGINGTFFDRRRGVPVGAVVADGELVRSTRTSRGHLGIVDGTLVDATPPKVRLILHESIPADSGLPLIGPVTESAPEPGEERIVKIDGVNFPRSRDGIVIYSRRFDVASVARGGVELVLVEGTGRVTVGGRSAYRVAELRSGGGPIPKDGVVLSALGAGAKSLRQWWNEIGEGALTPMVELDVDPAPPIVLASKPPVLRDGIYVGGDSTFATRRHPRTLVARTSDGAMLLVTIDGRTKGRGGMTLPNAARFLARLGVVDAANLDGGGSTTMTVRGQLSNRPSGAERAVATALIVIPRT